MKKFITVLAGFIIGFYIFMPKTEIFYFIQNILSKNGIYLTANTKSDIYKLNLSNGKIYYKSIKTAEFKKALIYPYIFYNKLYITDITLPIDNIKINEVSLTQNIIHPFIIQIKAESNIAKNIYGNINLSNKEIRIYFIKIYNNAIKQFLKKDKKGYYYYEKF
ncbi:hypothetical protein C3L23_00045 [Nautilia sp. PV-1]|uniref:hypothetical protein n=1 Tax=Nautilia sp. PV-1 TaxID=2579250 RepID=UPI000FD87BD9|nr:hypothetical protein [Nautilia sp. PV-1]AZV45723.1 hypothetical protein C3L23_00045 [Nautilia sp. PV-1]